MTKEEFEQLYADRSNSTIEWLHEHGRYATECNCGEDICKGWQMIRESGLYILDGHQPVKEPDTVKWALWMQEADRVVAFTEVVIRQEPKEGVHISTIFLGLDYGIGHGYEFPVLFETRVFGGPHDGLTERYHTWEGAEEGHEKIVQKVNPTTADLDILSAEIIGE